MVRTLSLTLIRSGQNGNGTSEDSAAHVAFRLPSVPLGLITSRQLHRVPALGGVAVAPVSLSASASVLNEDG